MHNQSSSLLLHVIIVVHQKMLTILSIFRHPPTRQLQQLQSYQQMTMICKLCFNMHSPITIRVVMTLLSSSNNHITSSRQYNKCVFQFQFYSIFHETFIKSLTAQEISNSGQGSIIDEILVQQKFQIAHYVMRRGRAFSANNLHYLKKFKVMVAWVCFRRTVT